MARGRGERRRERRGWTREAVVEALRRWAQEEGRAPRAYEWAPWAAAALGIRSTRTLKWEREHDRWPSLGVTVARFGSWRKALQSAGLPTHPPLVLPLQERVAMAQRLHGVAGVDESAELIGVSRWTVYGYWKAVRCGRCGGWQVNPEARTCLDCHARERRRAQPPVDALIELIRAWAAETGAPPRVTDWTGENHKWDREYPRWPSRQAVTERFGSWPAALQAAGYAPYVRRWSDQEILAALRALAGELGRAPTPADLNARPELFAGNLLGTRFGSHQRALLAAGLVPARRTWTREAIIDAFTRFHRQHGRWPTSADLRSTRGTGYPPETAVRTVFGDLHGAHRACGYNGPPQRTRFHADQAIRALRRFHALHGHVPSVREWDELAQRPSAPPIIRHFGSWNAAVAAAGLAVTRPRQRWSDQDIFAAIRQFEARHRRPPSPADFGGGSLPGFETVRVRFGSLSALIDRTRATQAG